MKIGIVGNGFVGGATALFGGKDIEVAIFDKDPGKCSYGVKSLKDLEDCYIIFLCLPTPMNKDGSCHTDIVDSCINEIKAMDFKGAIVVRSTVPVGFCKEREVSFMPEFLTEANWRNDFINTKQWILSGEFEDLMKLKLLIHCACKNEKIKSDNILFMQTCEAEAIKYVRNCFLAVKVSFFNEVFMFCREKNIDFDKISNIACLDERIGGSHAKVPGPDRKTGYGGSCFPKDMNSFKAQMEKIGLKPYVIKSSLERNSLIDRIYSD